MPVSSLASLRQFPEAVRPRLQVAYATAREALIETHQVQALRFADAFARRLPVMEALDLYFRVVPVPLPLEESILSRTLVALELDRYPATPSPSSLPSLLRTLRLDLILEGLRQRRFHRDGTLQLARLAGARAQEAVLDAHVANAVSIALILRETVWVDEAVGHYIHTFRLPLPTAYMVYQRARARMADQQLEGLLGAQTAVPVLAEGRKELLLPSQVRIAG